MIFPVSPVQIKQFDILESKVSLSFPSETEQEKFDPDTAADKYPLTIDFEFQNQHPGYNVFLRIGVNEDETVPGYSIFLHVGSHFAIEGLPKNVHEDVLVSLQESTISMTVSHARAFIINATATSLFGKYILPALDLSELLAMKSKELLEDEPKKKRQVKSRKR